MLMQWKKNVMQSMREYSRNEKSADVDLDGIRDCARRIADATLWGWDGGSRPFFWRWPEEVREHIRVGFPLWIKPVTVNWNEPQPKPSTTHQKLMKAKISDVRQKGYLSPGVASSLIRFFGVPKGDNDIRMVYDGTKSGLNDALWAPWFPLPTATTHLKIVDQGSWMSDNDAGEFFLNWMMDSRVRKLCGVDLTHFVSDSEKSTKSKGSRKVEIWTRCAMGLRPSPYVCVKGMLLAKEIIVGDQWKEDNVFRWDHVLLNLPGMKEFSPGKPWVSKRRRDGSLAADIVSFVDDLRPVGPSEKECGEASQIVSKTLARLGLQDAARKRNSPSQNPGPWAGVVITTDGENVYISVSPKKWDKTKDYVEIIKGELSNGRISHKRLESMTGYLVYVAQAYPSMKPYLAGLYGTLNSWRPNRTSEGFKKRNNNKRQRTLPREREEMDFENDANWRVMNRENDAEEEDMRAEKNEKLENISLQVESGEPPDLVRFVTRAKDDLEALQLLVRDSLPPLRVARGGESVSLIYGFGDASGTGFGSAIQLTDGSIFFRSGMWSWTIKEEMSSNYRELRNLVKSVEEAARQGLLTGYQLLLFTDNTTAEAAFHKGGSTSRELHELVLRLRRTEMSLGAELIVVHVSGKRMIQSGVDGVSRGDMNAGMMAGQPVYSFIPLHLSALERSDRLLDWITSWTTADVKNLTASLWPAVHTNGGTYLWTPAPAAADAALEWLGELIHKRSGSVHVVVVPRLMTCRWRKTLGKICDVEFVIPCGTPVWPAAMYEPLVLGISLPLLSSCLEGRSWRFKGSERVHRLETSLPRMWESNFGAVGDSLCQLLRVARRAQGL